MIGDNEAVRTRGDGQPGTTAFRAGPRRHGRAMLIAGAALAVVLPSQSRAQAYGDPDEGRRLSAGWCSDCHQTDPQTQVLGNDAVPRFQAVAERPSTTMMSLRAFLSTSHDVMPNYKLSNVQIDDISAYILSLRNPPLR